MLRAVETTERTDTGRKRRGNEDSFFASAPLFVVADGMGGAQAGEVASRIAVEQFESGLPEEGSPQERLVGAVQRANREIHEISRANASLAGMGTTLTAAYLDSDRVVIAHVGDSRAYLIRDGELTRLTEDHSLVEELRRKGRLTEEEAAEHPQRSIITRALGIEPVVEVDTSSHPVRAGDIVLLCSDGLTSMISEEEVSRILAGAPGLAQAADRLIAAANAAGGRDNITVLLFRVDDAAGSVVSGIEQPTVIASGAARTIAGGARQQTAGTRQQAEARPPARPPRNVGALDEHGRRAPLARTQGFTGQPREPRRHFGALGKLVAALSATAIVVFLVGAGGYLASRQLYFLGTNGQGIVTVYRGFPYVMPFGIPMYETFYVSGVPASTIPASRRATLLNHDLRSQTSAERLIDAIELGRIAR